MTFPFLDQSPRAHPRYVAFYRHCYEQIGPVATKLSDHRLARGLTREEFCTAIAYACIRSAALVIFGGKIPAEAFDGVLQAERDKFEANWLAKHGKQQ